MLFSPIGTSRLQRIQGAYIDEEQIEKLTDFWRRQGEPEFREELLEEVEPEDDGRRRSDEDGIDPDEDPLLDEAIALVAADADRLHVDAPAPPAPRLHARRATHRHARAPRGDLAATRAPSRARS